MKRLFIVLFIILALSLIAIYLIVPARSTFTESLSIKANPSVTSRILIDENWKRWWPAASSDSAFEFDHFKFTQTDKLLSGVQIAISDEENNFNTSLNVIPLSVDSVKLDWICNTATTNSPIKRIVQIQQSKNLRISIERLMHLLKGYLEQPMNTYGMIIHEERVKDTLLITTKSTFNSYPSMVDVYKMIHSLRDYTSKNNLKEMNFPMLHVMHLEANEYSTMVAIPVNKELPSNNGITYKRMAPGKILVTEIKGGPSTLRTALTQYDIYLQDYRRISPAIPFESLVTDRINEPDTSKWVTKIYYPVF